MSDYTSDRRQWAQWLRGYTAEKLFDSILYNLQGAESECVYCHQPIYCDIVEGGGVPDWKLSDGDYGCDKSPETCEDGCGGHMPQGVAEAQAQRDVDAARRLQATIDEQKARL